MTSIRRVYIAVTVLLALAVMAVYACAAEPDLLPLILIQRQREAAGMTPHAEAAPPIAAGPSEPAAKVAPSRPSASQPVLRAADHVAKASKMVAPPAVKQTHWTHPGSTRAALIAHLLSNPNHAGRHTRAQLESLSYRDLEMLHDADHNAARAVRSSCPNCANPRRGLFGWRR